MLPMSLISSSVNVVLYFFFHIHQLSLGQNWNRKKQNYLGVDSISLAGPVSDRRLA